MEDHYFNMLVQPQQDREIKAAAAQIQKNNPGITPESLEQRLIPVKNALTSQSMQTRADLHFKPNPQTEFPLG